MYTKQEIYHSYEMAALAIEQAIKEGWQLDKENLSGQVGFDFAVNLVREDEPKKTRAEILAAARDAKRTKNTKGDE